MRKIKSITEAFSMQPNTLEVRTQEEYEKHIKDKRLHTDFMCKEIILMTIHREKEPIQRYVGFNFEGKQIFEYLPNSVNVHFYPSNQK